MWAGTETRPLYNVLLILFYKITRARGVANMQPIHFLIIGKRQPPFFPICLSRHRCEIRRRGCHFLVYHRLQKKRSLNRLNRIFSETSSGNVRPLGIMPVCSVLTLEVSGVYIFGHLGYNNSYWLSSLPRVPLPQKGCTIVARDAGFNIKNLCPNSRKAKTEFTRMGFIKTLEAK